MTRRLAARLVDALCDVDWTARLVLALVAGAGTVLVILGVPPTRTWVFTAGLAFALWVALNDEDHDDDQEDEDDDDQDEPEPEPAPKPRAQPRSSAWQPPTDD